MEVTQFQNIIIIDLSPKLIISNHFSYHGWKSAMERHSLFFSLSIPYIDNMTKLTNGTYFIQTGLKTMCNYSRIMWLAMKIL